MKATCIYLLVFSLILPSEYSNATSKTVMIQGPHLSRAQFATIVSYARQTETISSKHLNDSPSSTEKLELKQKLEVAQTDFLSSSLQESKNSFESVVKLSRQADWQLNERKAIVYAYMRLAQLSENDFERNMFLAQAVRFDPDITPDTKLFPPPLISQYKKIKAEEVFHSKNWDISSFKDGYSVIKINGRSFDPNANQSIRIMSGENRVTLLSDKHPSVTRVMSANQVVGLSPADHTLANGSCASPLIDPEILKKYSEVLVVFEEDCYVRINSEGSTPVEVDKVVMPHSPKISLKKLTSSPSTFEGRLNNSTPPNEVGKSSKTLIAVGLVAIVAGIIYASTKKSEEERPKKPTHF